MKIKPSAIFKTVNHETPSIPKATLADRREELKLLPLRCEMEVAYQWLTSVKMEERIRGRCKPTKECQFLIDWLPNDLWQEMREKTDLRWRDWNFLFDNLCVEKERGGERFASKKL